VGPKISEPTHSLELISLGKADAEMLEYRMEDDAEIVGMTLLDIPFPAGTLVNAIIREDKLIPPTGNSVIKGGDFLYILAPRKHKKKLKELLQKKKGSAEQVG
jgi:cell volume regulation protein A